MLAHRCRDATSLHVGGWERFPIAGVLQARPGNVSREPGGESAGSNGERSTFSVIPSRISFASRGPVQNAPDTMACCDIRARRARERRRQRESVLRHRAKAGLVSRERATMPGQVRREPQSAFNLFGSRHRRERPDQDVLGGGRIRSKSHTHTWCHRHGERSPATGPSLSAFRIFKKQAPPMGSRSQSRRQGCAPSVRTQAEGRAIAPRALTKAPSRSRPHRPSSVSPSRSTPTTSSPRHSSPVTPPSRNSAPRASAARIIPAVKAAGCTCAVVPVIRAGRGSRCSAKAIRAVLRARRMWMNNSERRHRWSSGGNPIRRHVRLQARACNAKLRRARCIRGVPSHQSIARKPPDLPDAAQAIALRSMTMTSAPLAARW